MKERQNIRDEKVYSLCIKGVAIPVAKTILLRSAKYFEVSSLRASILLVYNIFLVCQQTKFGQSLQGNPRNVIPLNHPLTLSVRYLLTRLNPSPNPLPVGERVLRKGRGNQLRFLGGKVVAIGVAMALLFSTVAPPFAQAHQLRNKSQFIEEKFWDRYVKHFCETFISRDKCFTEMFHVPVPEFFLPAVLVRTFVAYHRGPMAKIIEIVLNHPQGRLTKKEKKEFYKNIDSTRLSQILGGALYQLLKPKSVTELDDSKLNPLMKEFQERFNLFVKHYNLSDEIKWVTIYLHEEEMAVDSRHIILAPLVNLETGEAAYFLHSKILQKWYEMSLDTENPLAYQYLMDSLIGYEIQNYSLVQTGMGYDYAQDLLENPEEFKSLHKFMDEVIAEILAPRAVEYVGLDGYTAPRVKEFLKDKTILESLKRSAQSLSKLEVLDAQITENSVKLPFLGGNFILLKIDEQKHIWRIEVKGRSREEESGLLQIGKNLIKLLTVLTKEKIIETQRRLVQGERGLNPSVLKISILAPLLKLGKKIEFPYSILQEMFQYKVSSYSVDMEAIDPTQDRRVAFLALGEGDVFAGRVTKAGLSSGNESDIEEQLVTTLMRRTLQSGLLNLSLKEGVGFFEVKLLHRSPDHVSDEDLLGGQEVQDILWKELFPNRVINQTMVNWAIAEGSVLVAQQALKELGYPWKGASFSIQGELELGKIIRSCALAHKFKVKTLEQNVDVIILAGGESMIRKNHGRLEDRDGNKVEIQPNVKIIMEAVPGAITPEAKELLKKQRGNIVIIPAVLATLGETMVAGSETMGDYFTEQIRSTVSRVFSTWVHPNTNPKNLLTLEDTIYLFAIDGLLPQKISREIVIVRKALSEVVQDKRRKNSVFNYSSFSFQPSNPRIFAQWTRALVDTQQDLALAGLLRFMEECDPTGVKSQQEQGDRLNRYVKYYSFLERVFGYFQELNSLGENNASLGFWDLLILIHEGVSDKKNLVESLGNLEVQMVSYIQRVRLERNLKGSAIEQLKKGLGSFILIFWATLAFSSFFIAPSFAVERIGDTLLNSLELSKVSPIPEEADTLIQKIDALLSVYSSLELAVAASVREGPKQMVLNMIDILVLSQNISGWMTAHENLSLVVVVDEDWMNEKAVLERLNGLNLDISRIQIVSSKIKNKKFDFKDLIEREKINLNGSLLLLNM